MERWYSERSIKSLTLGLKTNIWFATCSRSIPSVQFGGAMNLGEKREEMMGFSQVELRDYRKTLVTLTLGSNQPPSWSLTPVMNGTFWISCCLKSSYTGFVRKCPSVFIVILIVGSWEKTVLIRDNSYKSRAHSWMLIPISLLQDSSRVKRN